MLYSVYCLDKSDSAALRDEHRLTHRQYLDVWNDKLFFSGPLLDDEDEDLQYGSLFILKVDSKADAEAFIYNETFYNAGVFETVKIMRMRKGRYNPGLAADF